MINFDKFFEDLEKRKTNGTDILQYPHPALRFPTVEVITFDDNIKKLIKVMFEILYDRKGIGLAAPQVGLPLKLFIINPTVQQKEGSYEIEYDQKKELTFINPIVEPKKEKTTIEIEGCLSIPGLFKEVVRHAIIKYEAKNIDGKSFKGEYSGFVARIIQHENDHLHGKLFTDYLEENEWLQYLTVQFETLQKYGKFKSNAEIEEELSNLVKKD